MPINAYSREPANGSESTALFATPARAGVQAVSLDQVAVLVVEDDDSDAELIGEILGRVPAVHRLARAVDGRQALDLVSDSTFQPNLILLDLNMPRMDGFEFLARAREKALLRGVPVVVLTTSARYADVREALRGTASSYIVKPESVAELEDKVRKVITSVTRGDYLDRRM